MTSLRQRVLAEERMDDPALDAGTYSAVLSDLARVNAWTLAARPTLAFMAELAGRADRPPLRVLDVGFGQGDMLRRIADWAARRGVAVELTGVDLNPRSAFAARSATPPDLPIAYQTGDYRDFAGQRFDAVISSLVAHHMDEAELLDFLRFMEREAGTGWLVNDLHRHVHAYLGYPVLARLLRAHPIVRSDGRLSIARSFRVDDWRGILAAARVSGATVRRWFPYRLCVTRWQ